MNARTALIALLLAPGLLQTASAQSAEASMRTPACKASALYLMFDGENGAFAGMQQNGVLMVLRNQGETACTVLPQPPLTFADKAGKPVTLEQKRPIGMHPGPVQIPVIIPAGAEVTAELHWVANPVFDGPAGGTCVDAASATLKLANDTIRAPFAARVCGPTGKAPTYDLKTPLHRDPAYTPVAAGK